MTKKISEVASVGQLSDAEYLLGVAADGSIVKIEKRKAYPIATTDKNGLLSSTLNTTLLKNYGRDVGSYLLATGHYIKLFKFGAASNGQSALSHIYFGAQEVIFSGIIECIAPGGHIGLRHSLVGDSGVARLKLVVAKIDGEHFVCLKNVSATYIYGIRIFISVGNFIVGQQPETVETAEDVLTYNLYSLG